MKIRYIFLSSVCLLSLSSALRAAPSLPVTKPWVVDANILSGPAIDPPSVRGQWFLDYADGTETNRTHEFYDNVLDGTMGANAITGFVSSITYLGGLGTPILAFSIRATVWNDTTSLVTFLDGTNSHGESLSYDEPPYAGEMLDVKLTASFAITDTNNLPLLWPWRPYRDRQPYIEATNEDQAAWYCWSPTEPIHEPEGNYFVPTWDFGNIPQGQSSTRRLDFIVQGGGLLPADSRYAVIMQSFSQHTDVLLNRTTSLKISSWIDEIALDTGTPYPEEEPFSGSDVSVFHNIPLSPLDFGDAPDPLYPTLLANNGARHIIVPGILMGLAIDPEADGQQSVNADGDDNLNVDDEDGVVFSGPFYAGQINHAVVNCSTAGWIYVWVDFDANGSWGDLGESLSLWATQGLNNVQIALPASATLGPTCARFRFTTNSMSALNFTGLATDGEVEDYLISILEAEEEPLDFGDAPDPSYPTLLASDGARHVVPSAYWLGSAPDAEPDGLPGISADGDDLSNVADEDGVLLGAALLRGQTTIASIVASAGGFLDAWMDFNADGDWSDASENIAASHPLVSGVNPFNIMVPASAVLGPTYARFRVSSSGGLSYTGRGADGEVEDYLFTIYQRGPDTNTFAITNITRTGGNALIEWGGGTSVTYETEYTLNMLTTDNPPWIIWGLPVTGAPLAQTDTNMTQTTKFYRVVAPYAVP